MTAEETDCNPFIPKSMQGADIAMLFCEDETGQRCTAISDRPDRVQAIAALREKSQGLYGAEATMWAGNTFLIRPGWPDEWTPSGPSTGITNASHVREGMGGPPIR